MRDRHSLSTGPIIFILRDISIPNAGKITSFATYFGDGDNTPVYLQIWRPDEKDPTFMKFKLIGQVYIDNPKPGYFSVSSMNQLHLKE